MQVVMSYSDRIVLSEVKHMVKSIHITLLLKMWETITLAVFFLKTNIIMSM
jgi:hypothetical protein